MDRTTWMLMRAYSPVAVLYAIGFVLLFIAPEKDPSSVAAPIAHAFRWGSLLAMVGGTGLLFVVSYRFWRWERGEGPECPNCGGPLGEEKSGIRGRGDYRPCLQCSKNVNEHFYR